MKRSLAFQIYALVVCLFALVTGLSAAQGIWDKTVDAFMVDYAPKIATCKTDIANENDRRKLRSEKAQGWTDSYEPLPDHCDQPLMDAKAAFRHMIFNNLPWLLFGIVLFIIHWKLARKANHHEL